MLTQITLVVVEKVETGEVQKEKKYRLAGIGGVLKTLYVRSYIAPVRDATPSLMGLQEVLDGSSLIFRASQILTVLLLFKTCCTVNHM